MNERIKKLWEFVLVEHNFATDVQYYEKFAELIVKECLGDFKARIATRYQGSDKDRDVACGMEIVYDEIVQKFGVDE